MPDLYDLTAKARNGDTVAQSVLVRLLEQKAQNYLGARGGLRRDDWPDVIQEAIVEFLQKWDPDRSPPEYFFLKTVLPSKTALFLRGWYRQQRLKERLKAASTEASSPPPISACSDDEQQELLEEALSDIIGDNAVFLNPRERKFVRLYFENPDAAQKDLASTVEVPEASASVALKFKFPLEMMRWWTTRPSDRFDILVKPINATLGRWRGQGILELAAMGTDLLIAGLLSNENRSAQRVPGREHGLDLCTLLEGRVQLALAEQELGIADARLGLLEREVARCTGINGKRWHHRLLVLRGRRSTAAFRYDLAAGYYSELLGEVPSEVWQDDPLFLHSYAVSLRGVGWYGRSIDIMRQALETYESHGRVADVIHTKSRLARVYTEYGETSKNTAYYDKAVDLIGEVSLREGTLRKQHVVGYAQYLLHALRIDLQLGRPNDVVWPRVDEVGKMINERGLAHEFLELEELYEKHDLASRFGGSLHIEYTPPRPRFGQRVLARVRASLNASK